MLRIAAFLPDFGSAEDFIAPNWRANRSAVIPMCGVMRAQRRGEGPWPSLEGIVAKKKPRSSWYWQAKAFVAYPREGWPVRLKEWHDQSVASIRKLTDAQLADCLDEVYVANGGEFAEYEAVGIELMAEAARRLRR